MLVLKMCNKATKAVEEVFVEEGQMRLVDEAYRGKVVIAGPCALESIHQLPEITRQFKSEGIKIVRLPVWKPRTIPGWDGLGFNGLPYILAATLPHGLIPALEVLSPDHAQLIVECLKMYSEEATVLVWIGARNQNHWLQSRIAQILAPSKNIYLMFKNQMWDDEKHWFGIYAHLLAAGFPKNRLLSCHRGFTPGKMPNPKGYRNLPDFEMAMRLKKQMGIPMLLDPSHLGGTRENVLEICQEVLHWDFDGYMVEVHPKPAEAFTDARQQLSFSEFIKLAEFMDISGLKKAA